MNLQEFVMWRGIQFHLNLPGERGGVAAVRHDAGQERARPRGHRGPEKRPAAGAGQRGGADGAGSLLHQRVVSGTGLPHVARLGWWLTR